MCQLDVCHKVVHQFENVALGECCHVLLLDQYFSKLPQSAKEMDVFYLRPVSKIPNKPSAPWFSQVPIGKNTLSKMRCVQKETFRAKRPTIPFGLLVLLICSRLVCLKRLIQDTCRSGHRSLDGLRKYERV